MINLFFVVLFLIVAVFLLGLLRRKLPSRDYPYKIKGTALLSRAERSFYGVLLQVIGDTGIIFAQVRVADVITPIKGLGKSKRQSAFNSISSKHFDFVVCNPNDLSVKFAVELDDASHNSPVRKKRDVFLEGACNAAGLPLLRIKAARNYSVIDIQAQIEKTLHPEAEAITPAKPRIEPRIDPVVAEPVSKAASVVDLNPQPVDPVCPKCNGEMVLRKAKNGANMGKAFWGCGDFPKCRGVVLPES